MKNTGFIKRILIVILLIYCIFLFLPKPDNANGDNPLRIESGERPFLIAHGGGNHEFPDNTLEAFYHAYSIDSNVMMETDVSLTRDGVIILSHDTTLDRKTSLTNALIIETNYSDLVDNEIDFSYQNDVSPNSNGFNVSNVFKPYKNYREESVTPLDITYPVGVYPRHDSKFLVTTLEDLIKAFPNNYINVEIKQYDDVGINALHKVLELMDLLDDEYNTFKRIILASFHEEIFQEMLEMKKTDYKELMVSPETNSVIRYYVLHVTRLSYFYKDLVHVLQLPTEQYGLSLSTKALIRNAHRHNIAVHYWTIDDPDEMRRLIENGADGIMTNRPSVLKEVIDSIYP